MTIDWAVDLFNQLRQASKRQLEQDTTPASPPIPKRLKRSFCDKLPRSDDEITDEQIQAIREATKEALDNGADIPALLGEQDPFYHHLKVTAEDSDEILRGRDRDKKEDTDLE
ncbi:hypothetical protein H2200_008498 [Cladophialophora chaetospira]|uniref:Uncharacterized protein n=1 Tax=Cladophialophora chaetospira TaxID=386627 RepID=A0AA38X5W2_9EURO|nr:hypothetical protein H2200_008498 [Cladophialophora chaetospira]